MLTMFPGSPFAVSTGPALDVYNSSHSSNFPRRGASTTTPPARRGLAKALSSAQLFERLRLQSPPSPSPHHRTPSPPLLLEDAPLILRRKPRHVPIVIRTGVVASVLKDLPDSPELQDFDPTFGEYESIEALKASVRALQRPKQRPRHIPILIPNHAYPFGVFPPTPSDSRGNTPRASLSPRKKRTKHGHPSSMHRSGGSIVRPGTADSTASATSMDRGNDLQGSFASSYQRNNSSASLNSNNEPDASQQSYQQGTNSSSATAASQAPSAPGATSLSGLVCNVHKCTGTPPHALVGATTTVLGDKLYVFGGRRLSRKRPQLTADLYELDLLRRHWTKVEATGSIPPPRYFHSVCALGDHKLVCYGGMSPAQNSSGPTQGSQADQQPEVVVMSDIHIYDTLSRAWTHVPILENPQGRYAHCATVLPSSAVFSSANAPLSAIHNNPSSANPNQGSIGVGLDGTGGAEMLVVGGQDSSNTYIDQISVFNLRSLKWTGTTGFSRSCGAYRSVVAPLTTITAEKVGAGISKDKEDRRDKNSTRGPGSMLIYSNYNFLDVKLELQLRKPDGTLVEKAMSGSVSPPGLRFPNGGVLDNHFVVSGTYLTSSRQEYSIWSLDLRNLTWQRIDAGGSVFQSGSWNRGVLWPRRNTFVILGDRRRNLVEDYNHRRINFANICLVELEAFGLYENPRLSTPTSSYLSSSVPILPPMLTPKNFNWAGGGRPHCAAAEELGQMAMNMKELADMDILPINGERIPVNSHILARRWGPYFVHLMREGANTPSNDVDGGGDAATLKPANNSVASRNSSITITPSVSTQYTSSTLVGSTRNATDRAAFQPPNTENLAAHHRSRTLYLPHTPLTIQALLHFLYTSALPPINHTLSTPQILCSLLQLARPYHVDGLLEAVVERLHEVMDGRNAAAVFNASAMAAGGGRGTGFDYLGNVHLGDEMTLPEAFAVTNGVSGNRDGSRSQTGATNGLRRPSASQQQGPIPNVSDSEDDQSSNDGSTNGGGDTDARRPSVEASTRRPRHPGVGVRPEDEEEIWVAERSCVIGLQKRGLRGLMEGRRLRERGRSVAQGGAGAASAVAAAAAAVPVPSADT